MSRRRLTVIGFLGIDPRSGQAGARRAGSAGGRPSSLCQHEDLLVDRLVLLLRDAVHRRWREVVAARHRARSRPRPRCSCEVIEIADPWDFEEVYGALHDFARALPVRSRRARTTWSTSPPARTSRRSACSCWPSRATSRRGCSRRRRRPAAGDGGRGRHLHASSTSTCRATTASPRASRRSAREGAVVPQGGHRHPERGLQPADRARSSRWPSRSRDPVLLMRPDRRRQVAARAADLRAQEGAPPGRGRARRGQLRHAARRRRDVGAVRPRRGRLHRRGRGARRACCARRTRACCSSTRSASSASTSRRCSCARSRTRRFFPVGSDKEVRSDFQLIAGTNRDLADARRERPLPRGPAGAHQPVDLPPARPARAARGHRAEPRLRARTRAATR